MGDAEYDMRGLLDGSPTNMGIVRGSEEKLEQG